MPAAKTPVRATRPEPDSGDRVHRGLMKLLEAGRQLSLHVRCGCIRQRTGQRSAVEIGGTAQLTGVREACGRADAVQCRLGVTADHIEEVDRWTTCWVAFALR
jgi:hypothetical protein